MTEHSQTAPAADSRPLPPQPPPMREVLARQAAAYGERPFAFFDDRTLNYQDLYAESLQIAAGLRRLGVGKGDPVMLASGNRSEFVTSIFATAWLGAIAVPVNVALKGESLAHLFKTTRPRTALIEKEFLARVRDALGDENTLERIVVIGDTGSISEDESVTSLDDLLAGDPIEPVPIERGEPWIIMFTSGTTGVAKGVIMPHQQISSTAWDAVYDMQIDEDSLFYTFYPLYHLNGLIFGPMATLIAGAQTVVRSSFPRESTLDELRKYRATHWCSLPFLSRAMLAAPPKDDDATIDLRCIMTFGLLPDEVKAMQTRFGCRLVGGYGMTEAGMVCRLQSERPETSGLVSDRSQLRIVDGDGRDVPVGEVGEIWVRARQPYDAMLGYYRMEDATSAAYQDSWFRTGDLGRTDQDGYLYFVDRLKESLKRRGENISTFEVEKVLMSFPGVTTAAVVGVRPTPDSEEEVRAFIEGDPNSFDCKKLITHCAGNLAYFMVPRFVDVIEALPRTPVGKIRKQVLKEFPLSPATFDVKSSGIEIER